MKSSWFIAVKNFDNRNDVLVKIKMLKYSTTKVLMTTIYETKKIKLFLIKAKKDLMKKKVRSMTQTIF